MKDERAQGNVPIGLTPSAPSPWRWILALAIPAAAAAALILLVGTPLHVSAPGIVMTLAVVVAAAIGGLGPGLAAAALATGLARWVYHAVDPAAGGLPRYVLLASVSAIAAVLVGALQRRAERHLVAQSAARALEQFRDMVQDLDVMVWERDPATLRITFVSRRAADILGFPVERWLDDPDFWAARLHPDDRAATEARLRDAIASRRERVLEYRMIAADGHEVFIRDTVSLVSSDIRSPRVYGVMVEVTELKRTERALRESEARKSAIFGSALDAIVDMDEEGRITEFNPAAEHIFGHRREDVLGLELAEVIVPPSLRESHRRGLARFVSTGEGPMLGRRVELSALRADGSVFPAEIAIIGIRTDGRVSCTGFVRDISARRQAEDALRDSERNYRLLVERASDGILVTDLEGNFLDVNPKGTEMLGYSRAEILERSLQSLIDPEDLARQPLRLEALKAGETVLAERWLRRRNGTSIAVEISARRLDENRIHGLYRDITVRKRAEDELRSAHSLLSATLDATADGILVVDRQGRISSVNRRFMEMWSIPDSVIESRDDDRALEYVLDQLLDPQGFLAKVRDLYSKVDEESFDVIEFKDGRVIERTSKPQRIGGESVGRVWSFRDVTERQRAENTLRLKEEQLRQAQKMEAIGRLAGGVAHDFNNLLTAILGNSSLMLEDLPPGSPLRRDAEEIQRASERAAGLTRQLLAFSRKQVLEMQILDLNVVVAEMNKLFQRVIGEHIELAVVPGPDLGRVRVDPGQIEQVILNLVLNARDAMPSGGRLTIETANVDVDDLIGAAHPPLKPGPYVMISVSDTGVGMDSETQTHIFEPFFTTKERGKGTGLGLATVYGIVRQSEGHVWVYSEPARGTTFKIYLPRVPQAGEVVERATLVGEAGRGSEVVIVVEDDEAVRTVVRTTLQQRGYTVLEAAGPTQALRILDNRSLSVDLLLTDVVMPGMTGVELARRLLVARPQLRLLFMSGYPDDAVLERDAMVAGASFLQKPFTADQLARKVREILGNAAGRPTPR